MAREWSEPIENGGNGDTCRHHDHQPPSSIFSFLQSSPLCRGWCQPYSLRGARARESMVGAAESERERLIYCDDDARICKNGRTCTYRSAPDPVCSHKQMGGQIRCIIVANDWWQSKFGTHPLFVALTGSEYGRNVFSLWKGHFGKKGAGLSTFRSLCSFAPRPHFQQEA